MRIFLQQPPVAGENPKFVKLSLEQDLLGGWFLDRESGLMGGRSTRKRDIFTDASLAISAFEAARDQQLKRGFRVMFAEGAEAPRP